MSAARPGAGRTALITGASAGIGVAIARVFAAEGFDLVLTARRTARLDALKAELEAAHGVAVHVETADLARVEAPQDLAGRLAAANIAVDVLVNNAGYSVTGFYRDSDWPTQRDMAQVLVGAPLALTHHLLPAMHRRGYGRILNVASVAGLLPGSAGGTLYGASKAMLIAFSEALHAEQQGTGVHVTALCPGFTYSEFHDVNGTRARFARLPKFIWCDAAPVARAGYEAVMRNQVLCVPGAFYKTLVTAIRLMPRALAHRLAVRLAAVRR